MDMKYEKIAEILEDFWTDHLDTDGRYERCSYRKPDAGEIENLLAEIRQVEGQILFPGVSVEDGTLDPGLAASAEEEWRQKQVAS